MLSGQRAEMLPRRGGGGEVGLHAAIFPDGQIDADRHWRSVTAMKTGDTVADFELPDQTGTPRKLSALLSDGPVVLFFYPAAMTPGGTKEACHFRDLAQEFAAVGANANQFGVKRGLLGKLLPVKRTTFVIDTNRTVLDVISSELSMDSHADKALQTLRARS